MKKIILGTLVLVTIGMGFGFAETKKSSQYYDGYNQASKDYSKGNGYNPDYCDKQSYSEKSTYNCTQGYQDSWKRNSEVAPRTPKENSSKTTKEDKPLSEVAPRTPKENSSKE